MLAELSFFAFFACTTDVELCEDYVHPHYATVEYRFNWNQSDEEREDSMLVVASRVINLWKSSVRVSSTGDPSKGTYLWNAPEISQPQLPAEEDSIDSGMDVEMSNAENDNGELGQFKLRSGDYKFITFNRSDEEIDYEVVNRYMQDDAMPISGLNVVYKSYAKGDSALKFVLPDWTDYNGYGGIDRYMQPSLHAIYYDTISVRSLRSNGLYHITFNNIHRLTQHITLQFDIRKIITNQPFVIDSVFVEMAGIPCAINLSTGYIDITRTKKMMLKADFEQDAEENNRVKCTAVMDVPSIVQSASDDLYMGPGIMQVMICSSAPHPDDPSRRLSKKFQGIINLYHTLQKAELIRLTDDGQHALRNKEEAILLINADMVVDGEQVVESSDDNAGLDIWRKEGHQPIIIDI